MKNLSVVLNIVLLVAVAVLYFLFFKAPKASTTLKASGPVDTSSGARNARIGFFDMDSLENRYTYIKEVREQLKQREQQMSNEMNGIKKSYMERIQQLQAKSQTMSQVEGQKAQVEIEEMQQNAQRREAELTQTYQTEQFKMVQGINRKIEDFLKTFNHERKYVFIFSHQPGDFMYYKDSLCDITNEMVVGLNAAAKTK